ncbi:MAG: AraC family transcriptional regulator [Rikenellaceae bacterium]|nr:AraC family transcriptional regulator [Rikenellaceae bacterium]
MDNQLSETAHQPMIVKFSQPYNNGIQSHHLSRHTIGYVMRGTKYIYYGDVRYEVNRGEMFFLAKGHHYTEDVPEGEHPFEQLTCYYSQEMLGRMLSQLSLTYNLTIANDHSCVHCRQAVGHAIFPAWGTLRTFFASLNQYIRDECYDATAENIKMMELIYMIVTHPDCCIKSKVLANIDTARETFEQLIYQNIFSDISIEELASRSNRSMTSFKKEFRRHFFEPPHKWFIRQRLMHSRLLLVSTDKSISEVGCECSFPNTSHFIKLFKKQYGLTPAAYRNKHVAGRVG